MSSGGTRARIEDLTDTQRRVLDLIAEGRTNYEIGQALGITLDGAKYHVTEILNKLGVDSREEAAAALVAPRAGRTAWLSGKSMRRGIAIAAGVGAVALGIGLVLALLARDEASGRPAVQVAFLQGEPFGADMRIVVVDGDGNQRQIGETGRYRELAWSPDARHLMAHEATESSHRVRIFDVESGEAVAWEPAGFSSFAWSPDGRYLAVVSEESLSVRDVEGAEISVFVHPFEVRLNQQRVPVLWSPDSSVVAADGIDFLAMLGPDGTQEQIGLPESVAEAGSIFPFWDGPSSLEMLASSPQTGTGPPTGEDDPPTIRVWRIDLTDQAAGWEEIPGERPAALSTPGEMEAARAAGGGWAYGCVEPTAGAEGLVWGFVTEDRERLKSVVVQKGDELTVIAAPDDVWPISLRPCVPAVIAR
jgi:DNA-binding CsgD family transcriptional regulator